MLTILNVAFPFAEVGPDTVGGAEQVLAAVERAVMRAGHRSIVLAGAGSRVAGELVEVPVPERTITADVRERVTREYRERIEQLIASHPIDVIHYHGVDCAEYVLQTGPAQLVTLHLDHEFYGPALFDGRHRLELTCVSQSQRSRLPSHVTPIAVVENGVDLEFFHPASSRRGGYAACLGRICPDKGFDAALRAAQATDTPLRLAGRVFPYPDHERYFEESIRPLLDEHRTFVGPVAGDARRDFLAQADFLVVPSRIAETSSLVAMEALACGTPVLVSDAGALPTVIEPGTTGLVARSDAELVDAFTRMTAFSRSTCRARAEVRFDLRRVTAEYLALYERLARPATGSSAGRARGAA